MQESDKRERCSQNQHVLNINVGILGHVDSGKTSLAKALSTIASTAAFDKNPQSVERGITLDLGFSSVVCDLLEPSEGEGITFRERLPPNLFRRYVDVASIHQVQFTLVDCPGHASLIRTIIGGASIVDVMLLVIDVTKGIQTQTAECIVLGEVLARRLIVILNKVDLIRAAPRTNDTQAISDPQRIADEEAERRSILNKIKQKLRKVFSQTKWPHVTFLEAAAAPSSSATEHSSEPLPDAVNEGAQNPENDSIDLTTDLERRIAQKKQSLKDAEKLKRKVAKVAKGNLEAVASADAIKPIGMDAIIDTLLQVVDPVEILRMRNVIGAKTVVSDTKNTEGNPLINGDQSLLLQAAKKNFVMYVDHCFAVKGHGTVLTGTVTSGLVTVGDEVTLPDLQITKKVKSLQVFHESVQEARQGDRVGMCLTGLDPTLVERGIVCSSAASFPTSKTNPIPSSSSTITSASLLQHFLRNAKSGLSSVLHPHSLTLPLSQSLAAIESNVLRSNCFIAAVRKVRFYKQPLLSNSGHKYHITIGHNTCMGTLKYFSTPNPIFNKEQKRVSSYHQSAAEVEAVERKVQEASLLQLTNAFCDSDAIPSAASVPKTVNTIKFPFGFHYLDELAHEEDPVLTGATSTPLPSESNQTNSLLSTAVAIPNPQRPQVVYAIVQLDTPIVLCAGISGEALRALTHGNNNAVMEGNGLVAAHPSTILLASRFDTDIKSNTCRLAVEGSILSVLADWDSASSATASSTDRSQVPHPIVENTTKTAAFGGNGMEGVAQPAPPTPLFPPAMPITALHADLLHHHLLTAYRHIHWRSLPIFKTKTKALPVDKIVDDFNCIVKVPSQTDQLATATEGKKQGGGHNHSSTPTSHQSSRMPQQDVSVFVKQRVYCLVAQSRGGGTRGRGGRGRGATSTTQDTSEVIGDGVSINDQKSDTTAASNSVEWGVIEGTYGQHTNKLRVRFDAPVYRRGGMGGRAAREVILNYNKFPYASHK